LNNFKKPVCDPLDLCNISTFFRISACFFVISAPGNWSSRQHRLVKLPVQRMKSGYPPPLKPLLFVLDGGVPGQAYIFPIKEVPPFLRRDFLYM
jgi:hypothetical protein